MTVQVPMPGGKESGGQVFGADEQHDVPVDVARFLQLAGLVLSEEHVPADAELSVIFVDEVTITDLNERFLDGAGPTDVLAFPLDDDRRPGGRFPDQGGRGPGSPSEPTEPPILLGDVVVCPLVAQRQAEARSGRLDDELALLVVHGVLHLLDYDHVEATDEQRMRQRERELLAKFADSQPELGEYELGELEPANPVSPRSEPDQ